MPQTAWECLEQAMWARGWATVRDRASAWHLARGGAPVVFCDFSAHPDFEMRTVHVGRVRARWETIVTTGVVADLLNSADRIKWINADWAQRPAERPTAFDN
ncbi:hypothetical protein [Nocardia sp. NPDC004711]